MRIRILVPLLLIALGATAQGKKTVFSTMETNHIRVATPGLFSQRELIELPLKDIPDTEYSFPLPGGKVISPYGRGRGRHSGIDIKTYAKDTIRSAFNGVVRMSKLIAPTAMSSSYAMTSDWKRYTATTSKTLYIVATQSKPDSPSH